MRIARPDVNGAVDHGGGGLESLLVVDRGVQPALEHPLLLAARRVDRIELAVVAADVHDTVRHGRRGVYDVAGREFPLQHARRRIDGVDVAVAAAEVDLALDDRRRRHEHVPRVGDGLCRRRVAVQVPGLEATLVLHGMNPARLAGLDVDRRERARRRHEVDRAAVDRRRGGDRRARLEIPALGAGFAVDRVQVSAQARDVHGITGDRRRGHEGAGGLEHPFRLRRRRRPGALEDAGAGDIAVEGGLRRPCGRPRRQQHQAEQAVTGGSVHGANLSRPVGRSAHLSRRAGLASVLAPRLVAALARLDAKRARQRDRYSRSSKLMTHADP